MADYAVGDIQGCYSELMELLDRVAFNFDTDKLWVAGDMVSRGPDSDRVLKFLFKHRDSVQAVLGNHDLHLIAIYLGVKAARDSDRLDGVLKAKARHDWVDWLRTLPLCFHEKKLDVTMVHAGIAPQWTIADALRLSGEVEARLQGGNGGAVKFISGMYGNAPLQWDENIDGLERLRCITNYFTRMRVLDENGDMNFSYKGDLHGIPKDSFPWFKYPNRMTKERTIIFGHWASLGGYVDDKHLFGLDTGCVWGRHLSLMNIGTHELHIAQSHSF